MYSPFHILGTLEGLSIPVSGIASKSLVVKICSLVIAVITDVLSQTSGMLDSRSSRTAKSLIQVSCPLNAVKCRGLLPPLLQTLMSNDLMV